jgi:NAD(P)-dependent dehydrogenase (short-subunit alcohol dehydrogenase family)
MGTLDGRVAFVTGGARGIGRACVERLQAAGASVVFCDLDAEEGREVAEILAGGPAPVAFVPSSPGGQVTAATGSRHRTVRDDRRARRERGVDCP